MRRLRGGAVRPSVGIDMFRLGRTLQVIVGACALLSLAPAHAQPAPAEYRSTTVWWSKRTRIIETGSPLLAFAIPVIEGPGLRGVISFACPQKK
jgi:hypothetical protein